MSHTISATGKLFGLQWVCQVLNLPRSTIYAERARTLNKVTPLAAKSCLNNRIRYRQRSLRTLQKALATIVGQFRRSCRSPRNQAVRVLIHVPRARSSIGSGHKSMVTPVFATLIFDDVVGLPKSIRRHCGDWLLAPR
ncbi:MAG: hypothetical protein VB137_15865 [Burkholderia sp.]